MTLDEFKQIIRDEPNLMALLNIIEKLELKDCWLCAGTIRNYFWDYLSEKKAPQLTTDVDVIFFDPTITYEETLRLELELKSSYPNYQWELKNQVYMHSHNPNTAPYKSSLDALSKFPERCTAISVRLKEGNIELLAPYGIDDITSFLVQPTPYFEEDSERMFTYQNRVTKKNWQEKWPQLVIKKVRKKMI
ncbi:MULTISPECIES: nucleotidyltransferase family protein [Vagococcus]|uniref:Nucleotidyltransferase family protein n=1 Tax=Vagococcus fluvialis bH819 TaxID=1255619 RepID=A0A1X6WN78_9ENTE|nr:MULTISPECIES: nucleotidyltransferase family protein [Vagococcus]SLM85791.1 hypothetical protein FM121_06800 [Vagococcus fluvialis bH819]HCM90213.1 hypothetical protein [Vagococcus sp.]